ncbi:uncharacterized protein [Periplaneta americana]|uniref:uncharacterized protein isoform X2 n=1 Tax=Periplaneta americana TaxID=6978 RepID=UPI0037E8F22B
MDPLVVAEIRVNCSSNSMCMKRHVNTTVRTISNFDNAVSRSYTVAFSVCCFLIFNTTSWVFMGLMHGDVFKAKMYIRFEKSLLKLQKQFVNLNTIIIQLLFCFLAKMILCPKMGLMYVVGLYVNLSLLMSLLKRKAWKTLFFVIAASLSLNVLSTNWSYTVLTAAYLLLIKFAGVPGEDSWPVATIRSWKFSVLGGVEEFWVPILTRIFSALLSTLLTLAALPNRAAWQLCMWVWYSNVYVFLLHTFEWYWPPMGNQLEHRRQYPTVDRQGRDWSGPCSICLEHIQPCTATATTCGHIFHGECLKRSLTVNCKICPLCRWPLVGIQST